MTAAGSEGALRSGQPFQTVSGRHGRVGRLLGAGGQGEVYDVSLDGLTFALKWYHAHYAAIDTTLRTRLDRAVRRGAPTEDFLWPLDLVDVRASGSFGYVMLLRSPSYVSIRDLIVPPPRRLELSLPRRARICLQLANSFLALHASGFCYQDVNFGNIFLDPGNGKVLICDNDNVNIDGAEASIYGTRKFMAPEVVRRECLPSSRTDLFSMSVLFFYTLFGWHPLDGRREAEIKVLDAAAELKLYGTEPRFLFDPEDDSNGPVPGYHDAIVARWRSLPGAVRTLFTRAFTSGLHDPSARVLETEWRTALRAIEDATVACPNCGFEHAADYHRARLTCPGECLACGGEIACPPVLLVNRRAIFLAEGHEIERSAIEGGSSADIAARVEAHPSRPGLVGLRNRTGDSWSVTLPGGDSHDVPAGQAVRIVPGSTIRFPRAVAQIAPGAPSGEAL